MPAARPENHASHPFEEPSRPFDFTRHAWLHGADESAFEVVLRDWRLRLYEGRVHRSAGARTACLRQGFSGRAAGLVFVLGFFASAFGLLAGSELGRDFRQHERGAGAAHAGLLAPLPMELPSAALLGAGILGVVTGAWLGGCERKHVWLVAHPPVAGEGVEIWVAGTSNRRRARFDAEFDAFLERARTSGIATRAAGAPSP